jgi:carboxypeptidase C (cathepsin A)
MSLRKLACALFVTAATTLSAQAGAPSDVPPAVVTHHTVKIGGKTIAYTATAGDTLIRSIDDQPIGTIYSFAYVRDNPRNEHRPVIFVFDGGPGSSSLWLHMGVIGPKHVVLDRSVNPSEVPPYGLSDNPDSLLDIADVVFVDPVGTGFSKTLGQGTAADFFGVDQDADTVAQFIELWLGKNGRWNAPKFILGESYGSFRACLLPNVLMGGPITYTGVMRGIAVNGVILVGTALDLHPDREPSSDEKLWSATVSLPGYAAAAWYHYPQARGSKSLSQVYADATQYAKTEYLDALRKASTNTLSDPEREAVVARLSAFTHLAASDIPKNLEISGGFFAKHLVPGSDLGRYDSRYTLPDLHDGGEPVADDPAMGQYVPPFMGAFHEMLTHDLKVTRDEPYYAIRWKGLLDKWQWKRAHPAPGNSAAADLAIAMRRNPRLRVLIGAGYYDLNSPAAEAGHDIEEAGLPTDRATIKLYESGHMLYIGETGKTFADDMRALIREAQ